jgi:hypothetical protein
MEYSNFESTREFFNAWSMTCEDSFGRLAEIPAVGLSREKYERGMKGFSLFINLYATWMDSVSDINNLSMEAINKMQDKTGTLKSETGPERSKELYDIWIETYRGVFNEFLRSEHFVSDIGKFMSIFADVQRYNRDMLEENVLIPSNIPTKTDIDEINKELYDLRKKVKELSTKLGEFPEHK